MRPCFTYCIEIRLSGEEEKKQKRLQGELINFLPCLDRAFVVQ